MTEQYVQKLDDLGSPGVKKMLFFARFLKKIILIQALRIFVESVLRYGLPVNFRAAIVIPGRNQKKLRDKLNQIFEPLDSAGGFNQAWGLIGNCLVFF